MDSTLPVEVQRKAIAIAPIGRKAPPAPKLAY